jgi:hypothetical protein
MFHSASHDALLAVLRRHPVELPALRATLGGVSERTVFRHLRKVPYRRSYNKNGRYYALHDPDRHDRHGLWSWGDVYFSVDGSLPATVVRLVGEAEPGATHDELRQILRVRVHNTLLGLVRARKLARVGVDGVFVYLNPDPVRHADQLAARQARIVVGAEVPAEVADAVAIEVLLVLIRHPGSTPGDVVRRLQGRSPPVARSQVDAVFARYGLGEKGGPWTR